MRSLKEKGHFFLTVSCQNHFDRHFFFLSFFFFFQLLVDPNLHLEDCTVRGQVSETEGLICEYSKKVGEAELFHCNDWCIKMKC